MLITLICVPYEVSAQLTWSPVFFSEDDSLTISFGASAGNGDLEGFQGDVYLYTGVITSSSTSGTDWKYVKPNGSNGWSTFPANLKMNATGSDQWLFTFAPSIRDFFDVPDSENIEKIALLFRGEQGGEAVKVGRMADGSDWFIPIEESGLTLTRLSPARNFTFCNSPCAVDIEIHLSTTQPDSTRSIRLLRQSPQGTYSDTLAVTSGDTLRTTQVFSEPQVHKLLAIGSSADLQDSSFFDVMVSEAPLNQKRPDGLKDGITEHQDGSVSFSLFAPNKSIVHLVGDFNDWNPTQEFVLKRDSLNPDSTWFWTTLTGLEMDKAYRFQYLVDGEIRIADPYSELILDPNDDRWIPASINASFPNYPVDKTQFHVGVFELDEPIFEWSDQTFTPPPKEELVIYELLLRDFVEDHTFETLIDTLDYLERLGVNAIELMPVNEFEGNSSWGYNPSHYFAVDKYYGTKKQFKRFVNESHRRGIAIILDMVLNHSFGQSPMVRLYAEGDYGPPTEENPWFNQVAKHDFNVGYDMNHERLATQYFVDRVTQFWLEEFHIDGFRFDLSKGFTQRNTLGNVGAWGQYDESRIRLLKRMADHMWSINPDAYVILEHFAEYREERELASYGALLWRNMNYAYGQATMGFASGSDFSGVHHLAAGFPNANLIGYMESHDEQWLMYKNVNYGNSSGDYSVRDFRTALTRQPIAGAFFFLWPGPKMIWQFGELGYGGGQGECLKGHEYANEEQCLPSDPGRTAPKPIRWTYRDNPLRYAIYEQWSAMISLRKQDPLFTSASTEVKHYLNVDQKWMYLQGPSSDTKALIVGNFGVEPQSRNFKVTNFTTETTWYDYFSGDSLVANEQGLLSFDQQPGEFSILTTKSFATPLVSVSTEDDQSRMSIPTSFEVSSVYPNPFNPEARFEIDISKPSNVSVHVVDILGRTVHIVQPKQRMLAGQYTFTLQATQLSSGTYFVSVQSDENGFFMTPFTVLK
ncbi:MAG: T9SS C-terminal target domain-containing protein [Rhodothermaceae bacterium TMED105]|nr:MAG: T9SS C-terminal target domain-containing protein [Rhodothermaceae bacterium TMED105]